MKSLTFVVTIAALALIPAPHQSAKAGSFLPTGSLVTARTGHTATSLFTGIVLVTAGTPVSGAISASAELYDPGTGTWTATSSLSMLPHTATLLSNGKVLVAGGTAIIGYATTSAELYDPPTTTWTATGVMDVPRPDHTATLLHDGRVLVAGGAAEAGATAELYDPATGRDWTAAGQLATPRWIHSGTLLASGKVLIAGGDTGSGVTNGAEMYDPTSAI